MSSTLKGPEFAQGMLELDGPFTNVNKGRFHSIESISLYAEEISIYLGVNYNSYNLWFKLTLYRSKQQNCHCLSYQINFDLRTFWITVQVAFYAKLYVLRSYNPTNFMLRKVLPVNKVAGT